MRKKRKIFTEAMEAETNAFEKLQETDDEEVETDWTDGLELEFSNEDFEDVSFEDESDDDTAEEDEVEYDDDDATEGQSEEQESEEQEELEDIDLAEFEPSVSNPVKRIPDAGVLSIVNSNNGKRVVISSDVMEKMQKPTTVQIGYSKDAIAISRELGSQYTPYTLKKSGAKSIIYCTELVKQITDYYGLDFSDRTSITFSDVTYRTLNGRIVALISVK